MGYFISVVKIPSFTHRSDELQQGIYPGWNIVTRFSPMTVDEFAKEVQEATYVVYDTQHPCKDMTDKDLKEAKDDFDKEVKNGNIWTFFR